MSRVENIKNQVKELSQRELAAFREWFAGFDAEAWDRKFEANAKEGELDSLAERALRGHDAGHGTPAAELVPAVRKKRVLGSMRGLVKEEDGWDAPVDDRDADKL